MEHVCYVVVVLNAFEELLHLGGLVGAEGFGVVGYALELEAQDVVALLLEVALYGAELGEVGVDHHAVVVGEHLLGTVVDELELEVLHVESLLGLDAERAFALEQEVEHADGAKRAAVLVEVVADVGHGAGGVVGGGFHHYGDARWPVAAVNHLFVVGGVLVGGAFDGALHVVLGHALGLGGLHEQSQAWVVFG